jgi:hypothetical protein
MVQNESGVKCVKCLDTIIVQTSNKYFWIETGASKERDIFTRGQ